MLEVANSTQIFLLASGVAVGAGITAVLTSIVQRVSVRFQLMDRPNARSMHTQPVPRVGGIAIVGGVFGTILYFLMLGRVAPDLFHHIPMPSPWLLAAALFMFTVGLWDDLRTIQARTKLAMQCAAALFVVAAGFRFNIPFIPVEEMGFFGAFLSAAFTFAWIIGIVNALNLLDGLDGLAAGVTMIAIISLAVAMAVNGGVLDIVLVAAMVGALLGFLVYNTHPATIFMGDSGSLFLGFVLATFALPTTVQPTISWTFLVPILAMGLPILDTTVAIVRRAAKRQHIFAADRDHIHHRVARYLGYSHGMTVKFLYGISGLFGLSAVAISMVRGYGSLAVAISVTLAMVFVLLLKLGYLAIPRGTGTEAEPVAANEPLPPSA